MRGTRLSMRLIESRHCVMHGMGFRIGESMFMPQFLNFNWLAYFLATIVEGQRTLFNRRRDPLTMLIFQLIKLEHGSPKFSKASPCFCSTFLFNINLKDSVPTSMSSEMLDICHKSNSNNHTYGESLFKKWVSSTFFISCQICMFFCVRLHIFKQNFHSYTRRFVFT